MPLQSVYRAPGTPLLPPPVGVTQKPPSLLSLSAPGTAPLNKKSDLEGPPVTVFVGMSVFIFVLY